MLFSGLFLVALTWLGAREVAAGRLSVGELISFFGYAVFMVWPIQTFFELAQRVGPVLRVGRQGRSRCCQAAAAVAYAGAAAPAARPGRAPRRAVRLHRASRAS